MKRYIFLVFCALTLLAAPMAVYASGGDDSGLAITVVIPDSEPVKETAPAPTPTPNPARYLYPVSVTEARENGKREIIKVYELGAGEKPDYISRESFIREGWLYELTDIIKKETATADGREHEEIVTLNTDSKDTETVMKLLAPTLDYQSEDGYIGVLDLDISSVKVETAGIKNESFTASAVREYPHLSSNDSSFVPKTISDGGREYTLANVEWKTQDSSTVDYDQLPDSYTAVAKYTRTGYKEVVTGYVTTAVYRGSISKILSGKTVYTAHFIGVPIVSAAVGAPSGTETADTSEAAVEAAGTLAEPEPNPAAAAESAAEPNPATVETAEPAAPVPTTEVNAAEIPATPVLAAEAAPLPVTAEETEPEPEEVSDTEWKQKALKLIKSLIIALLLVGAAILGGFIYKNCIMKPDKKDSGKDDEEYDLEEDWNYDETDDTDEDLKFYKIDDTDEKSKFYESDDTDDTPTLYKSDGWGGDWHDIKEEKDYGKTI